MGTNSPLPYYEIFLPAALQCTRYLIINFGVLFNIDTYNDDEKFIFYLVSRYFFLEVVKVDIFIVSVRNSFSNFLLQNPRHLSNRFGIDFPNSLIKLSHIALKLTCRTMSIECNVLHTGCSSKTKSVKSAVISHNVFHLK